MALPCKEFSNKLKGAYRSSLPEEPILTVFVMSSGHMSNPALCLPHTGPTFLAGRWKTVFPGKLQRWAVTFYGTPVPPVMSCCQRLSSLRMNTGCFESAT